MQELKGITESAVAVAQYYFLVDGYGQVVVSLSQ